MILAAKTSPLLYDSCFAVASGVTTEDRCDDLCEAHKLKRISFSHWHDVIRGSEISNALSLVGIIAMCYTQWRCVRLLKERYDFAIKTQESA